MKTYYFSWLDALSMPCHCQFDAQDEDAAYDKLHALDCGAWRIVLTDVKRAAVTGYGDH